MDRNGNGHGGLWQPGQIAIGAAHLKPDGVDIASSVGMVMQQPGAAPQVFAVGGFTQLEALAVALAPLAMRLEMEGDGTSRERYAEPAGKRAAEWAKEMLAGIKEGLA